VELFDRSHRQIRLTGAGEVARALPGVLERCASSASRRDGGDRTAGPVTMGLMTGVDLVDVPGLLGRSCGIRPSSVQLRATGWVVGSGRPARARRDRPGSARGRRCASREPAGRSSPRRRTCSSCPTRIPSRKRDAVTLAMLEGRASWTCRRGTGRGASSTTPSPMPGCRAACSSRSPTSPRLLQYVPQDSIVRFRAAVRGRGRPFADRPWVRVPRRTPCPFEVSLAWARRRRLRAAAEALVTLLRDELLPGT
jgi:hypothetical protein